MLLRVCVDTNIITRHVSDIHRLFEPRTSCKAGERAFRYIAPRLYNKLPKEIKDIKGEKNFKKKLKTFLFERSYDRDEEALSRNYVLT